MYSLDKIIEQTLVGSGIPHMGEPNFRVYCDRPTTQTRTDSIGNVKPVIVQETFLLSLREDKQSRNSAPPSGSTIAQLSLIGRSVNPTIIPIWLSIKKKYKAEKIDAATGLVTATGEFEFDAIVQHRQGAFTRLRGSFVKGTFTEIR